MSLTGKTKASSYKDLLHMNNNNNGVGVSLQTIKDGEGDSTAISLSDDSFLVKPVNDDSTLTFAVSDKDTNLHFEVDTTNNLVKAGLGRHIVNTQIKEFALNYLSAEPATTDVWTALNAVGSTSGGVISGGTHASNIATSISIDGSTNIASTFVQKMWYVPFDITVDAVHVWWGADADDGDPVKFNVNGWTVDSGGTGTSGDLELYAAIASSGAGEISGAGDEQAYYKSLTMNIQDIPAGKVILAFVKQGSTNSDLTVNMQLVYHLR